MFCWKTLTGRTFQNGITVEYLSSKIRSHCKQRTVGKLTASANKITFENMWKCYNSKLNDHNSHNVILSFHIVKRTWHKSDGDEQGSCKERDKIGGTEVDICIHSNRGSKRRFWSRNLIRKQTNAQNLIIRLKFCEIYRVQSTITAIWVSKWRISSMVTFIYSAVMGQIQISKVRCIL